MASHLLLDDYSHPSHACTYFISWICMDPHSFYLLDPDLRSEKLLDPQKMNADPQSCSIPTFTLKNIENIGIK